MIRTPTLLASVALAISAKMLVGVPLEAQSGPGGFRGRPGGPGGGMGRMLDELSLSDAQRQDIRGIVEDNRESGRGLHEQLRATRRALNDAITAASVNESEIRALAAQIAPLEAEAAVQRAHTHAAVMSVLTPDQRDELETLRKEARERFHDRIEERRDRRQRR